MDLNDPGKYLEQDALERVFSGFGREDITEARKLVKAFFGSPLFRQLQRAKQVRREVDFVLNLRRGLVHGKLDVLFEDEEGEWHILDYKTALGDELSARKSGYDLQIAVYALAAHKILGVPLRSGILYYLKNNKEVVTDFPSGGQAPEHFEKIEKQICALQEKILNFSNEMSAKT